LVHVIKYRATAQVLDQVLRAREHMRHVEYGKAVACLRKALELLEEAAEQNPVVRECKGHLQACLRLSIDALENPEDPLWISRTLKACLEPSIEEPDVDDILDRVRSHLDLVLGVCWIGICKYEEAEELV